MKWCAGPCGRELPLSMFHNNGAGRPHSHCKDCRRVADRNRLRLKYRFDSEFRERVKARMRAAYAERSA